MNPNASPFEAMVGLALRGSDWQKLQNTALALDAHPAQMQETVDPGTGEPEAGEPETSESELDTPADEAQAPRQMTAKQQKKMMKFEKSVARDTGKVHHVIRPDAIAPVPHKVSWEGDPELLCSYNWKESHDGTNTIFVPGAPAKWQVPSLPFTIENDKGISFTDYNYARHPRKPYTAMFHALKVMNPRYSLKDVDVLADRNNLRVLLEFCQGKWNGPFRLNIFLKAETLVITRQESKWWRKCDGVSRGWEFEKQFTRPTEGLEEATSHYRVIRYPLGPLNAVVRFEADAYDDGFVLDLPAKVENPTSNGNSTETPNFSWNAPIRVLRKGHSIPATQIVELKTQKHNPFGKNGKVQCQDQLWFGRTSRLITGPYDGETGVVNNVKYEIATERIKSWEEQNQESLRKLPALLVQLRTALKQYKALNEAGVLLREGRGGNLVIRSLESNASPFGYDLFNAHWGESYSTPFQAAKPWNWTGRAYDDRPAYRIRGHGGRGGPSRGGPSRGGTSPGGGSSPGSGRSNSPRGSDNAQPPTPARVPRPIVRGSRGRGVRRAGAPRGGGNSQPPSEPPAA